MLELNKILIHQHQIPGKRWGTDRSPYKVKEVCSMVNSYRNGKGGENKSTERSPTGGVEATSLEKM